MIVTNRASVDQYIQSVNGMAARCSKTLCPHATSWNSLYSPAGDPPRQGPLHVTLCRKLCWKYGREKRRRSCAGGERDRSLLCPLCWLGYNLKDKEQKECGRRYSLMTLLGGVCGEAGT
jgi:hypothetical protein